MTQIFSKAILDNLRTDLRLSRDEMGILSDDGRWIDVFPIGATQPVRRMPNVGTTRELKVSRGRWGGALLSDPGNGKMSLFGHYLTSIGVPCESMTRWTLPYHPAREHGVQGARDGTGFFHPEFVSAVIRLEDAGDEHGLVSLFETINVRLVFED